LIFRKIETINLWGPCDVTHNHSNAKALRQHTRCPAFFGWLRRWPRRGPGSQVYPEVGPSSVEITRYRFWPPLFRQERGCKATGPNRRPPLQLGTISNKLTAALRPTFMSTIGAGFTASWDIPHRTPSMRPRTTRRKMTPPGLIQTLERRLRSNIGGGELVVKKRGNVIEVL